MNPPPVSTRRVLRPIAASVAVSLAASVLVAGCQRSEPDLPRPPPLVIEARAGSTTLAHIIAGHPCRAEIEGDELLIGTQPLVAQVGNIRWSGDDTAGDGSTTLRKDGAAV